MMTALTLKVIGCGDAFGSGGRLNTCFYLHTGELGVLMDCGASALPGLKKWDIETDAIDIVLISHFHGDHYGGLPFLLMEAAALGRKKKLRVVSPSGAEPRVRELLDLLYPGSEVLEKLDVEFIAYVAYEQLQLEDLGLTAFPVIHTKEALPHGLRIELGGKIISYSGDTSWTDTLVNLSLEADLFICECNFYSTKVNGHLDYLSLREHIPDFKCKRLLLTHLDEEMLQRMDYLTPECAYDGMEILLA